MIEPQPQREALSKEEQGEIERQSRDLWSKILALQERFSYFVLAASGSAAVFAVVKTGDAPWGPWVLPAMAAVLTWGVSFCLSAWHLQLKVMALLGDRKGLEIRLGKEPITSQHPELIPEALQRLGRDKRQNDGKSAAFARWAFSLLILGGVFYLIAHVQRLMGPDPNPSVGNALSGHNEVAKGATVGSYEGLKHVAGVLKDTVTAVGALVGAVLGIYNLWHARIREQAAKRSDDADWQRWVDFVALQRDHPATLSYQPKSGSDDHRWAERMVAKGMLERESGGRGYSVRG